jgi:hypothetical protein
MYRPDYGPRKRRKRLWWVPVLLLGLLFGLVLGGRMTSWWGLIAPSANDEVRTELTTVTSAKTDSSAPTQSFATHTQTSATKAPEFILPNLIDDSLEYSLADYAGR